MPRLTPPPPPINITFYTSSFSYSPSSFYLIGPTGVRRPVSLVLAVRIGESTVVHRSRFAFSISPGHNRAAYTILCALRQSYIHIYIVCECVWHDFKADRYGARTDVNYINTAILSRVSLQFELPTTDLKHRSEIHRETTKPTVPSVLLDSTLVLLSPSISPIPAVDHKRKTYICNAMRDCILKQHDPEIGDYFFCSRCKHFMLSKITAESHKTCTEKLFKTFEPKEKLYRCSSCGRYFDELSQWYNHDQLHKVIGNYDPSKFVLKIDENNFVVN